MTFIIAVTLVSSKIPQVQVALSSYIQIKYKLFIHIYFSPLISFTLLQHLEDPSPENGNAGFYKAAR